MLKRLKEDRTPQQQRDYDLLCDIAEEVGATIRIDIVNTYRGVGVVEVLFERDQKALWILIEDGDLKISGWAGRNGQGRPGSINLSVALADPNCFKTLREILYDNPDSSDSHSRS